MQQNIKFIYIAFFFIFFASLFMQISAQTYNGNVALLSQTDINDFGAFNYTEINGDLTIDNTDDGTITDLSPLYTINSVINLTITVCPNLVNLNGLSGLLDIYGDLYVAGNSALTNLDGLSNLSILEGSLTVINNNSLGNFCGLFNLLAPPNGLVGTYTLNNNLGNPTQQQIIDNEVCAFIGDVTLTSQAEVNAFGASNYGGITESLTIRESVPGNITDLTPLLTLTFVGANLEVSNNSALTNLSGLSNISSLGNSLTIDNNGLLANLDGLSNLTIISNDLSVTNNAELTNLDGLSGITSVGGSLMIVSNLLLTNLDGLSSIINVSSGSINVNNNASLKNLDGLSSITSAINLVIRYNAALTSLDGLSGITSIGSGLTLSYNAALTNLDGLKNLTYCRTLSISDNGALTNLDGLSNLASVDGRTFKISNNSLLSSFCGLYTLLSTPSPGGLIVSFSVSGNLINPTKQEIIDGGACPVEINIKVYFEGPYNSPNNMSSAPTSIPLSSPYSQDTQTVDSIPTNVVDWVQVELRDKNDRTVVVVSRSAFLLQNGNVVDIDGTSPVAFDVSADDYYIAVKHRNHLAVMSDAIIKVN